MRPSIYCLLIVCLPIAACKAGPQYNPPQAATLGVPQAYVSATGEASPADLEQWWIRFDDAELNALVKTALEENLDIALARSRLLQARESLVQSRAALLPTVSGSGQVSRSESSGIDGQTSFSLGVDASWEADLFGGNRRSVEASRASAENSAYNLAATRVSLVADVASNYISARLAQQRLILARQSLAYAEDNLQIARWRNQAGLVSSLDVEEARSARAQVALTLPGYEQSLDQAVFRLGVLTGQAPGALSAELAASAPVPKAPDAVGAGIPADTLRQRPDVRAAERNLAAETARIGVAKAALYPSLRIGGSISTSAPSLSGLADQIAGSLFATLSQTIFDGGATRSKVRSQEAAAQGAFASYKQSVLTALEDVEKALVAVRTARQQQVEYAEALDAARNQAILARSNYRAGLSNFQTLLEAERSLISAGDGQLVSDANRTSAIVQLYRALGGGWNPENPAQE